MTEEPHLPCSYDCLSCVQEELAVYEKALVLDHSSFKWLMLVTCARKLSNVCWIDNHQATYVFHHVSWSEYDMIFTDTTNCAYVNDVCLFVDMSLVWCVSSTDDIDTATSSFDLFGVAHWFPINDWLAQHTPQLLSTSFRSLDLHLSVIWLNRSNPLNSKIKINFCICDYLIRNFRFNLWSISSTV